VENDSVSNKNIETDANMDLNNDNASVSTNNNVPSCNNNFTADIATTGDAIKETNSTIEEIGYSIPTADELREYVDKHMQLEKQQSKRNGCPSPLIYAVKYL
jgi:hypothetical protein